ncbi:regulator of chromosome condensation [Bacillus rossius redtenbacheri]|uniref:regulator of chromosome condensation n=1 Tax=Bacillus rossius redtenbacheri TaxID=93214 RepID=UPI002FDDFD1B
MPIRKRVFTTKKRNSVAAIEPGSPVKKTKRAEGSAVWFVELPPRRGDPGLVLACGQGDVGQLGLGDAVTERSRPALVPGLDSVVQVCAGGMHTVAVDKDGQVLTAGCNDDGALGRDTAEEGSESRPGKVSLPAKAVQVSAGDSHSAALLEDGRVFAWGSFRDFHGVMGLTKAGVQRSPVQVLPSVRFAKVASGVDHLVLLSETGEVYTCGCGEQGQLGRVPERAAGRDNSRRGIGLLLDPAPVKLGARKASKFSDIWAVSYGTFIKEKDKDVIYVFGLNNYCQLGLKDLSCHFHPQLSAEFSGKKWLKICGGLHHTLALDSEGITYSLGREEYGRLGLGQGSGDARKPTPVLEEKCVDIACGGTVSFAVTDTGQLYGWGMGSNGQLGLASEDDVYRPAPVRSKQLEARRVLQVDAGGQHTVILASP